MNNWDLTDLPVEPRAPRIISSSADARAIVLRLPAGDTLEEHEVHERAWLVVVEGEVEIDARGGVQASGGAGLLTEFEPRERHRVRARSDARLLVLLTPWPGSGHPGAMSLEEKGRARERARQRATLDAA
jgi:redox-sensitive bicupin YhaK (pirin superfamily)